MRIIKGSIKLYLATALLCIMLVFALKVNTSAASEATVSSDRKTVYISLTPDASGRQYEVALYSRTGKKLGTTTAYSYATFTNLTTKNRVYFYNYRVIDNYGNPATGWSKKVALTTIAVSKYKLKAKGNRTVRIKVPKIKGVSSYRIYMKTYYSSGSYKKVKTVKPGKTIVIKRFRGKKFKWNTYYSVKMHPVVKKKIAQGSYPVGTFHFYKVYRLRYKRIIYI